MRPGASLGKEKKRNPKEAANRMFAAHVMQIISQKTVGTREYAQILGIKLRSVESYYRDP